MCGIVGLIARRKSGFFMQDLDLLQDMLVIDSLRGKDSVGVFSTYRNNEVEALKLGSNVYNLFRCREWKEFRDRINQRGKIVIGHNRAATRGAVTTENAHPFSENNIMLVHNGTLFNHDNLSATRNNRKFDVDSHAIAHALSESSVEEVIPKLHGAYALVWYDTEKRKLCAIRNHERPLYLITTEELFVLSSEAGIAGLPMMRQNRKIDSIDPIPPNTLLEFSLNGEWEQREIKPHKNVLSTDFGKSNNSSIKTVDNNEDFVEDDLPFVSGEDHADPSPTRSCVLTEKRRNDESLTNKQVGLTQINTVKGFTSTLSVAELDKIALSNTARLQVKHLSLVRGKLVIFRPIEITRNVNYGKYQFRGKLHELGEELVETIGYFPEDQSLADLEKRFRNKFCMGRVLFVTETACGTSVYLSDVRLADDVRVYGNHRIPMLTWSRICADGQCGRCGRRIHTLDRDFTAVTLRHEIQPKRINPVNQSTIVCAVCIKDTMTGEIKNAFNKRRDEVWKEAGYREGGINLSPPENFQKKSEAENNDFLSTPSSHSDSSLQDRESLSQGTGQRDGKIFELPGSKTLQ